MERFRGLYDGEEDGTKFFILYDTKTGTFYGRHNEDVCTKLVDKLNELDKIIKEMKKGVMP